MSLSLDGINIALGVRLRTISGLRVMDNPGQQVVPPTAIIEYPDEIRYDSTFQRGADEATWTVYVVVSKVIDRAGMKALSPYVAGSGSKSIKAAIEGDKTLQGQTDSLRITRCEISPIIVADVTYLGATFEVELIG